MDDFLTKLGLNSKTTVGVSISSNNMIEMICVDKMTRSITKYAARELRYNTAIREIIDYEEMETAVGDLFRELNLNPAHCNVVLNLPNVQFAFMYLPLILSDDQVTNAIMSEVEQLYLFKRHEPIISWNSIDESKETDKRYIAYAALQDSVLTSIREVFENLGVKLIAVENSHSSMLKGIQYSKIVEDEMAANEPFNILLITSNSYAIFCMNGNKLVDYYEEPLAIKSFTDDEVYLAISSAAGSTLENYPTKNLLLISETNDVSAELLSDKINFDGAIKYLDRNKYSDKSFMNIDFSILQTYIPMITLESVGAATYAFEDYPVKFNFMKDIVDESVPSGPLTISLFGKEIEVDRKAIFYIIGGVVLAIVLIFSLIGLILNYVNGRLQTSIDKLTQQQQTYEAKIKESKISVDVADIYTVSQQIFTANKQSILLYDALSAEIPPQVWIDSFYTDAQGQVSIIGKSTSSEYIYAFFKGLRKYNPDIYLSKLQLDYDQGSAITDVKPSDTIYVFEIDSSKNKKKVSDDVSSQSQTMPNGQPSVNGGANTTPGAQSNPSMPNPSGPNPTMPQPPAIGAPPSNSPAGGPPPITSAPSTPPSTLPR